MLTNRCASLLRPIRSKICRFDTADQAGQDRRQGGELRPLRRIPAGRGGRAAPIVRDDPVAHRPPAGTTHTGMSRARAAQTGLTWETRVLPELEQRVQAQLEGLAAALAATAPTACHCSLRNMRIPL